MAQNLPLAQNDEPTEKTPIRDPMKKSYTYHVGHGKSSPNVERRWKDYAKKPLWSDVPHTLAKKIAKYYDKPKFDRTAISVEEQLDFCRQSVPSWNDLPETVTLSHRPLTGGTQSFVALVKLEGPGSDSIDPKAVVYRLIPVQDGVGKEKGVTQSINGEFVRRAAGTGVAPKIYETKGVHRVTEFAKGEELFGGSNAFDWLAWHRPGSFLCWSVMGLLDKRVKINFPPDNSPDDLELMHNVGSSLGKIHAISLDWLPEKIGQPEFDRLLVEPAMWPRTANYCLNHDVQEWSPNLIWYCCGTVRYIATLILFCVFALASFCFQWPYAWLIFALALILLPYAVWEIVEYAKLPRRYYDLANRVKKSTSLPREGLFAQPVWTHTDMHAGNFMVQPGKIVRIIDWDGATLGHRGMDLSFFLGSAHMPSKDARRAFARGYLVHQKKVLNLEADSRPSETDIENFLWDVERCMPLALIAWAASFMIWPQLIPHAARIINVCERCLEFLESDPSPEQRQAVVEEGLVSMMDPTFSFGCLSNAPCCCVR